MSSLRPWRAVAAIACGHLASMAVVAAALAFRLPLDRAALQWGAGVLLVAALACRFSKGHALAGQAGMALWTFITSTTHGAGFVLMPALITICGSGATGLLSQAVAALGLHLVAMLAANGAVIYLAARLVQWFKA
ncbi:hypothetical protein SAMN05518865_12229 [Duganella sp. CF458]|uniref:hypothetical protein n=1 Tax=Duganella sp. CF458 TaxID=1884368 RepID=UPI0008F331D2|nr:hypothetical protein [Duganella sp. CF458]SFG90408.1 hypothetical protein SAMN05518865_12229 [Duganella sp. CF458]